MKNWARKIFSIFALSGKLSKKTFGKIGLFLVFGMFFININFTNIDVASYANAASSADKEELIKIMNEAAEKGGFDFEITKEGETVAKNRSGLTTWVFEKLLEGVGWAISKILVLSGYLLELSLNKDFFNQIVGNSGLYTAWVVVRDILNLLFMLILLFSAFSTIFQVERFHLKKVIILLVVMALLVNFSFAITLFIIDASNSLMYFLLDAATGEDGKISGGIMKFTELGKVLDEFDKAEIGVIILNIIFLFIACVTLFAFAINFLIRVVALAVLIILSPAGFAFGFFPSTQKLSSSWWGSLFKYAIMGPVMAFTILAAFLMFNISEGTINSEETKEISSFAYFIIPTIFLWFGLIASQKFGGMASATAMGVAKKTGSWAGKKFSGYNMAKGMYSDYSKARDERRKSAGDNLATRFGKGVNTAQDSVIARAGGKAAQERLRDQEMKETQAHMKKIKDQGGISDAELDNMSKGSKTQKMAAALYRSENNRFDKDPHIALKQYQDGLDAVKENAVYDNAFRKNSAKNNVDLSIRHRFSTDVSEMVSSGRAVNDADAKTQIAKEEFAKLAPDQWKDQNIERLTNASTPDRGTLITEASHAINDYSDSGKENVTRNMNKGKYAAGKVGTGAGLWI